MLNPEWYKSKKNKRKLKILLMKGKDKNEKKKTILGIFITPSKEDIQRLTSNLYYLTSRTEKSFSPRQSSDILPKYMKVK